MKTVEIYARVRHAVLIEGISERAAADRFGINARTVSKMLKFSVPLGYVRTKPPFRPKLDEFVGVIDAILAADKDHPKKQRHTGKRIFERLRDEHCFTGKITIVKDYVAGWRQRRQEMFVPLVHPPGHAQADFGEAIGVIGGVARKIHFFAMDLPHSDAIFVVGYARRNFLVPIPVFADFEALNAHLLESCRKRLADRLRGHDGTIGERLEHDLAAFQKPLPAPYDACEKKPGGVNSLSLVRYRLNDYSVPTAYGHRKVLVRGYVHEVVIACGAEVIARHPRSYEREDFVFNPLHYLALIEQKTNALDQAAPLADWKLPDEFATMRRLLEARMGKKGKREFVQVLRLMEVFQIDDVAAGVRDAIARGAVGFDAVKHLVLCRIERRPPRLDMTIYPYLPKATVATTSARSYMDLLAGVAA
jgi:transposase